MSSERCRELQDTVLRTISGFGRSFNPDVLKATYALYGPLQEFAPKDGIAIERDLAYGPHQQQRLDLFFPTPKPTNAPIVAYFHGGGYIGGERSPVPNLIYDNVATFFARNGMIGANATYRLAPEFQWPSGGEDVGHTVDWLQTNAAVFGGDPTRIFVIGQSAGGTHVATWALNRALHGPSGPGIAGALLLSPVLAPCDRQYNPGTPPPHRLAYFGAHEESWDDMNLVHHVAPGHPPIFISVAEFEPPDLQWSAPALVAALMRVDQQMPWFRYLRGHNHVSPAMQINLKGDALGPDLIDFIRQFG